MKKILLAGESWFSYTTHVKGFDSFYTSNYATGEKFLKEALEAAGHQVTFMPNHEAMNHFPFKEEQLNEYDVVILSDIGANTLLLPDRTFSKSEILTNRVDLIRDYVLDGGSLIMIGGYMTFSGVDAKGKWHDTSIQEVLPVEVLTVDDRQEHPEGIYPETIKEEHPILKDIDVNWQPLLGYNKTLLKSEAELIASIGGDPFIAAGKYGKGKSVVFTSDCAPHWAPPEFCNWESYPKLWQNMIDWLTA